jgi:hypothetical protein
LRDTQPGEEEMTVTEYIEAYYPDLVIRASESDMITLQAKDITLITQSGDLLGVRIESCTMGVSMAKGIHVRELRATDHVEGKGWRGEWTNPAGNEWLKGVTFE